METTLKAGPMSVIYKIRHKGVKAVICRYLDTYCYFFALDGEVYIDFVYPPNKYELKNHKTTLNEIEPKLIEHLCSKAIENIEHHQSRLRIERSWNNKSKKFITELYVKSTRWITFLKSRFVNASPDQRSVEVPGGGSEGSGNEHGAGAEHAAEAGGVRS